MVTDSSVMAVIRASRPSFRNAHDKVAFAVHASFLASGYLLTATGPPAYSENALSSPSSDEVGIDKWNETEDCYAFIYSNPEKGSKKVLVKCLVMGSNLLIDVLREGDGEPLHLEINVEDYNGGDQSNNYSAQYKNLEKLVRKLDAEILSKLDGSRMGSSTNKPLRIEGKGDLDMALDRDEFPPWEDVIVRLGARIVALVDVFVLEVVGRHLTIPRASSLIFARRHLVFTDFKVHHASMMKEPRAGAEPVPSIGGSDLFPGPGAGMYPTRGNYGSDGGMLLGPNDPRWFGGIGGEPGFPGGRPGVPPGARFDPYGPPGVPGFEPNRFVRDPRRPGGRNHPDLEHFGDGSDII
ncbi:hypothetical protein HHK36_011092 [Tetracentron sinense]|uniref:Proteasome inhibitor PI31 subunit n=1 Tax=Tetracentron sinense TaxID=13715 RepID=A0A834ZCV5_TETSI|nr:hypothetical protein HHK36_011092 [Tetracentron sinense]